MSKRNGKGDGRRTLNKKLTSASYFQVDKLGLRVSPTGTNEKIRKEHRKSSKGNYTIAFINDFERLTEQQLELKEVYALNLIANYAGMDRKFFRLESLSSVPTVLGGNYTYRVMQGDYNIGKLSISITITRLTGKNMCVIFNERNAKSRNTRKKKK